MDKLRSIWNDAPAIRLLLPYLAGVLVAIGVLHFYETPLVFEPQILLVFFTLLGIILLLCGVLLWLNNIKDVVKIYRLRFVSGAILQTVMFCLGALLLIINTRVFDKDHIIHQTVNSSRYIGIVNDVPVRKEKTTMLNVRLEFAEDSSFFQPISGNVLVMLHTDSSSNQIHYGDELIFSAKPELLNEPKNPYEFNYAQYQRFHNIYHRVFLNENAWKVIAHNKANPVLAKVYALRDFFLSLIKQFAKTKDELAVASAIMLGYRDYMNADIVQAYASSGALHVLSVSGLHVGVLFIGLQFVFGFMSNKGNRWRYAQAAIFISVMLLYAVLTGLSPSVLRAVVMFSFVTLAKAINRNTNMYNILAVSALLLLLYNPYLITEIGFKLSYLAVLGIVVFHPLFYQQLQFKNKIADGIWSLTCISLAAQLATFPVSLYYFHQFPNLFLLSNLIVIPISDFILYSGMLLFLVFKIPFLFDLVGNIFYWLIWGVNKFIYFIDKLPFALIEEIQISQTEMYLLYVLLLLALFYLYIPKSNYFLWLMCAIVAFAGVRAVRLIQNEAQHSFVVYSVKKHSALCFINNTQLYTVIDSGLLNDENAMLFHIKKHWWAMGLNEISIVKNPDFVHKYELPFGTLYEFRGRKILQLTQTVYANSVAEKLQVDELILSKNQSQKIATLNNLFSFQKIIFDSSNGFYKTKKWREDCAAMNIPFYDVSEFAYIREWNNEKNN